MLRTLATAAAVALAVGALHSTGAEASKVAWSVSIGGPGIALTVAEPAYVYGGPVVWRGHGHYRPWWRHGYAAPAWLPPQVVAPAAGYVLASPYAPAYPVVAPWVWQAPVAAPVHVYRRAVVPAPVLAPPYDLRPRY